MRGVWEELGGLGCFGELLWGVKVLGGCGELKFWGDVRNLRG